MLQRVIQGPYRVGPWPGLSASGAVVLLLCAIALGAFESAFDWQSLPVLAITALAPIALATRIVNTPGAASAVCGAYLLPRTLLTLAKPEIPLPPWLFPAVFAFDLALWLRRSDVRLPWRRRGRSRQLRRVRWARAAIAGAVFGLVLSFVQPPFDFVSTLETIAASSVVALISVRGTAP